VTNTLEAASATETRRSPTLHEDAETLRKAIRKSVATSPEAFLKTVDDVNGMSDDYWEKDIDGATWAVIEKADGQVVGIAVSRRPHRDMDKEIDPDKARFIESVWIAPELRRKRMGERLVRFLFEVECENNPEIEQFFLWVFEENYPAICLYQRMKFASTGISQHLNLSGRTEIKYQLTLDTAVVKATETAVNEAARRKDLDDFGVTYRVLGAKSRPR
jgi:ribosomal protein S18 acetylase RimI-like enzyme